MLGKNGAGKTTLLELVLGFTPATSGGQLCSSTGSSD
nr:MAG: hypothetical protein DIU57_17540 [Pseudomonadota bacterium]